MDFDHQQAVSSQAVERYLLGELLSPLREEFENHFFGCPQCAEALRAGAILQENGRALLFPSTRLTSAVQAGIARPDIQRSGVANTEAAAGSRSGWMPRLRARDLVSWSAVFILLLVVVKQRQDLARPFAESATPVTLRSDARGAAFGGERPGIATVASGGLLSLAVDVPEDGPYRWALRPQENPNPTSYTPNGSGVATRGELSIVIDSRPLPPGVYIMAVSRQTSTPLPDRLYYFELKRAQKD